MLIQQPEQNSKRGSVLLMVLLAGVLLIIIGTGTLVFYQKQFERRVALEFEVHRILAAKSGFALAQYTDVQTLLTSGGTGTYHYVIASNRPHILVTVGKADPIYAQDFAQAISSNWTGKADAGGEVSKEGSEFVFKSTSPAISNRNELVFRGTNVSWNNYPFGLCYAAMFQNTANPGADTNTQPWAGYIYVGASNDWSKMFTTNVSASLAVFGDATGVRRLETYQHISNSDGTPVNSSPLQTFTTNVAMNVITELYMDHNNMAFGAQISSTNFVYGSTNLPAIFSSITNVVFGVGGFNHAMATNHTLNLFGVCEVRPPYEYVVSLTWTNNNRFLGPTGAFTKVQATVVDKTTVGNRFYFFDSFRTIVGE